MKKKKRNKFRRLELLVHSLTEQVTHLAAIIKRYDAVVNEKSEEKLVLLKELELEDVIVHLAKSGRLAEVGRQAIAETHALGLSATILEDGDIVNLHPDGTKTVVVTKTEREEANRHPFSETINLNQTKDQKN